MVLAGAGLLIFRPDANAMNLLGWIWPLALIALAVWMAVQARRNLRSLARRLVLYPLFVGLVLVGIGGSYETIQEQVDRSATATPGHLVDVGGRRLYVHCTGSGSPTVLLVSVPVQHPSPSVSTFPIAGAPGSVSVGQSVRARPSARTYS